MTLLLSVMALLVVIFLAFLYVPVIITVIRFYIDDKAWEAASAKRQGKIINMDRTAFDGRFGPVALAIAVLFLFLFLVLV